MEKDLTLHWNKTYERVEVDKLGWYEESPEPSMRLLKKCNFKKDAVLLNVGTGASTFIDELIQDGFENVIANDISAKALDKLKIRLAEKQNKVRWIVDDLTHSKELNKLEKVDLWHDRAVLHFFTELKEQNAYFDLVKKLVKQDGYAIIASFSVGGANKCSGLPVHQYDVNLLKEKLGENFTLVDSFDYTYTMPSGDSRAYIYTLFKKVN